jgi:hypothetical protein
VWLSESYATGFVALLETVNKILSAFVVLPITFVIFVLYNACVYADGLQWIVTVPDETPLPNQRYGKWYL